MTKRTPWTFTREGAGGTRFLRDSSGHALMSDTDYYPWCPDDDETWRLFAAAPEMYEALKQAMTWMCCIECGAPGTRYFTTEGDGPYFFCDSTDENHAMPGRYAAETETRVLAPSAIAKAEGK